ncbi:S8 family peptidase [Rhizobium sp. PP-CC-3G-465]|uniref:S8 family peptidase n=1 Tax=Rhizobium sp. PP-CC-3G-465 TaxID=2135648 RepID=UPI0010DB349B|nr:subtilase family protein [Rhizobium sp. PP-CC-3G-465]
MQNYEFAPEYDPILDHLRPRMTGNIIVTLHEGATPSMAIDALSNMGGDVAVTTLGDNAQLRLRADINTTVFFEDIGVAFLKPAKVEGAASIMASLEQDEAVLDARPEFYFFALQEFRDTSDSTWGVGATGALQSPYTGKGVRIAILDTGIDLNHPDFQGKRIVAQSFVYGETVDDLQGHGTHCAGTAAARSNSPGVPRYGVAPNADLYVGKVLNNSGYGTEEDILAGMEWAIAERCDVISMSLGSPVQPRMHFSEVYERVAREGLEKGTLILAAAGNDSRRAFGAIAPVSSPANTPSIISVGAVDPMYGPAPFSNGGINPGGGELDIVAPGVGVFSSAPYPQHYRIMDGTSMACPHAAGVAALWAETDPKLRGTKLRDTLIKNLRALPYNVRDVGRGLVRAPLGRRSV